MFTTYTAFDGSHHSTLQEARNYENEYIKTGKAFFIAPNLRRFIDIEELWAEPQLIEDIVEGYFLSVSSVHNFIHFMREYGYACEGIDTDNIADFDQYPNRCFHIVWDLDSCNWGWNTNVIELPSHIYESCDNYFNNKYGV